MNVFVLCTGRCGSLTFVEAARHATNYTAGHESHSGLIGDAHFAYPPNHVEADNRLSWFLGRLDAAYGDEAFYVHLRRDTAATAKSFLRRYDAGILQAYRSRVVRTAEPESELAVCLDYVHTVNANIELFLRDKTRTLGVRLESAKEDFRRFWELVGAQGDLDAALAEWDVLHNASPASDSDAGPLSRAVGRVKRSLRGS